jgi:hypothetical protein
VVLFIENKPKECSVSRRFVPPDVLSCRMFCLPDVLSRQMFCPAGRFVSLDVLSHGPFVSGCYVTGRFVSGRFVSGRFVWAPFYTLIYVLNSVRFSFFIK